VSVLAGPQLPKKTGQHPAKAMLVEKFCNGGLNEALRKYSKTLEHHLCVLSAQTLGFSALQPHTALGPQQVSPGPGAACAIEPLT
jgi:hypothetical protein